MPDVYTWIALAVAATAFVLGIQVLGVTAGFALIVVVLVSLTAAAALAGNRARRRLARRESRFQRTDEVFHDPATGAVTRVHVDPNTGERRYWEER
jgi:membrane protein implicated in regulation of membrane protease activity